MEEETKKQQIVETKVNTKSEKPKRKVSKAWEAAQRLKGRVVVTDPTLFYR